MPGSELPLGVFCMRHREGSEHGVGGDYRKETRGSEDEAITSCFCFPALTVFNEV